ncbi:MAG: hypothetical protein RIT19_1898 [Verrucomicrobiota bacterium]|jgi:hypothetical protein
MLDLLMKSWVKKFKAPLLTLVGLVSMGGALTGCRTEDELIGRPWNTPKSWETGLPSAMTEGR